VANTVSGNIQAAVNLTTVFDSTGTAGSASEVNNLGTGLIAIDPGQAAGRILTEVWSHTYTGLAAPVTLDLTALVGIGSRAVNLPALRGILAINADSTVGHDVKIGPGASNGLVAPWDDATAFTLVNGGMPGAGVVGNNVVGNPYLHCNLIPLGWVIDSTHKTITIDPGAFTVTLFKLILF
jgi:hypothetical protein